MGVFSTPRIFNRPSVRISFPRAELGNPWMDLFNFAHTHSLRGCRCAFFFLNLPPLMADHIPARGPYIAETLAARGPYIADTLSARG